MESYPLLSLAAPEEKRYAAWNRPHIAGAQYPVVYRELLYGQSRAVRFQHSGNGKIHARLYLLFGVVRLSGDPDLVPLPEGGTGKTTGNAAGASVVPEYGFCVPHIRTKPGQPAAICPKCSKCLCTKALYITATVDVAFNVLQVLFHASLYQMDIVIHVPVFSIVFVLAVLLFARYMHEDQKLKQEHDLII